MCEEQEKVQIDELPPEPKRGGRPRTTPEEKKAKRKELRDENGQRKIYYRNSSPNPLEVERIGTEAMQEAVDVLYNTTLVDREPVKDEGTLWAYWCEYVEFLKNATDSGHKIIPDIEGFMAYTRTSIGTWRAWRRGERGQRMKDTADIISAGIASVKNQLAMKGGMPPIVWIAMMNNMHDYVQNARQEVILDVKREPKSIDELLQSAETLPDGGE